MNRVQGIEKAREPDGAIVLTFLEPLDFDHSGGLWDTLSSILAKERPGKFILDFHRIDRMDSAGIALLRLLRRHCSDRGIPLEYRSVPTSARYFLRFTEPDSSSVRPLPTPLAKRFVTSIGRLGFGAFAQVRDLVRFVGSFALATADCLLGHGSFRWKEGLYYAQLSGSDAMPIVFLMSFLIGLVMAFQGAVQLRQFGANIYVADLLSLALTRELGPVFTAVILAGRSGSAFAAEIGTMKVNEEVDALTVMGFDTTKFLVLPKVFALALAGPLLTVLANASGILGGMVVGIFALDLTARSFLEESFQILSFMDIATGLMKSLAFAVLIALIGCFRGLQAKKGADSVGRQTTSAVVSGIFLIIIADAVFTVLFHVLDW